MKQHRESAKVRRQTHQARTIRDRAREATYEEVGAMDAELIARK